MPIAKGDERHMQHRYCIHCTALLPQEVEACSQCGGRQESQVPYHHLLPGTVLNGRYWVGAALGEGGFGITYIGRDLTLDRRIAIKEYFPSGFATRHNKDNSQVEEITRSSENIYRQGLERFLREAQLLAQFSKNVSIVSVFDYFEANGTAYFIMEYLSGDSLKQYLDKHGPVSYKYMMAWFYPIFQALAAIHQVGVVHRDISPDNLILASDGNLKLIDFGAARDVLGSKSLSVVLKPGYAPIEQYSTTGKQGPWTDIYALCGTIYKCITGVTPPEATDRIVQDTLRKPSDLGVLLPKQFENTLMKGLSIRAEDRYQSMEALLEDLGQPMDEPMPIKPPEPKDEPEPKELLVPRGEPVSKVPGKTETLPTPDPSGSTKIVSPEPVSSGFGRPGPRPVQRKRAILMASAAAALLILAVSSILIFGRSSHGRETLSLPEESLIESASPIDKAENTSTDSSEEADAELVRNPDQVTENPEGSQETNIPSEIETLFASIEDHYKIMIHEKVSVLDDNTRAALEDQFGSITYQSASMSVAYFRDGVIGGVNGGTAIATLTIAGWQKEFEIEVNGIWEDEQDDVEEIILGFEALDLTVGTEIPLDAVVVAKTVKRNINFSSSNPEIAAVSHTGVITAQAPGQADIIVSCNNEETKCHVTVYAATSKKLALVEKNSESYDSLELSYNAYGQLIREEIRDPNSGIVCKQYDKAGNIVSENVIYSWNGSIEQWQYERNAYGDITVGDCSRVNQTLAEDGFTQTITRSNDTISFEYQRDDLNRITFQGTYYDEVLCHLFPSGQGGTFYNTYSESGRLTSRRYVLDPTYNDPEEDICGQDDFKYDDNGRLIEFITWDVWGGSSLSPSWNYDRIIRYYYDADGNIQTETRYSPLNPDEIIGSFTYLYQEIPVVA